MTAHIDYLRFRRSKPSHATPEDLVDIFWDEESGGFVSQDEDGEQSPLGGAASVDNASVNTAIAEDPAASQAAIELVPSTTGGASKIIKTDASSYLRTGPSLTSAGDPTPDGGLRVPAKQRITWEGFDGSTVANVWMFANHGSDYDANAYPELVWTAGRHCYYWEDGLQFGNSTTGGGERGWRFAYLNPLGQACAAGTDLGGTLDTQMESIALQFRGGWWNGSAAHLSAGSIQYVPDGAQSGELGFWIGGPASPGGQLSPGGSSAWGRMNSTGGAHVKAFGIIPAGPQLPSGKTLTAAGDFSLTQGGLAVLKSDFASALADTVRITNGKVRVGTGSTAVAAQPFEVWRQVDAGNTTGEFYIDANGKTFIGRLSTTGGNSSTGLVVQDRIASVIASFNPSTSASVIGGNTFTISAVTSLSNSTDSTSSTTGAVKLSGGMGVVKSIYSGANIGATGYLKMGNTTVGALTAAATAGLGATMIVTDSLAPAVGVAVAAGGSAKCVVTSNGTDWIVTSTL